MKTIERKVQGLDAMPAGEWRRLEDGIAEFQSIVRLLTDFDERTGRIRRRESNEDHYMRGAIGGAREEDLSVYLFSRGGGIYVVLVELKSTRGEISTFWLHEDGIRLERDELKGNPDHPVHSIPCIPDLYDQAPAVEDADLETSSEFILDRMREERERFETREDWNSEGS